MPGLFVILFLAGTACREEPALELEEGEILNELHGNNIGKLVFMSDWIPFTEFTEADFNKELTLFTSSDLGFRMFLGKTLTYYLSELAPEMSVRELCEVGNFQLTFYVDNKEVYQYDLQPGAGSCEFKNEATVYGVPLINKNNPDHWGRFLWVKFMELGGGKEALAGDSHLLRLEVRPYLQREELKVGEIIAEGEVQLTFETEDIPETKMAIQAIEPTPDWEVANVDYDTSLIRLLNQKIAQRYYKDITSIVVVKNGKLLLEEYFNNADRNSLHDTRSVGKTLASTVMGIAIKEGYIKDENQTLKDFYPLASYQNYSPEKEQVTLKSLLTMSSGLEGTDFDPASPGNEENMYPTDDWVKFGLDLPMDENKSIGKDWDYLTAGAVILGDVLNKSVPEGLEKYADQKLFQPLGISDYQWQYTTTNVPNTAGGFQMNSLSNARYGQLYLDQGEYQGRQILPAAWVSSSLTKQIAISESSEAYYGYLLWNKQYTSAGNSFDAFYASGNGGNKIMIFPDLDAVIVVTAKAYGQPYMHKQVDEIITDYLLPVILN